MEDVFENTNWMDEVQKGSELSGQLRDKQQYFEILL